MTTAYARDDDRGTAGRAQALIWIAGVGLSLVTIALARLVWSIVAPDAASQQPTIEVIGRDVAVSRRAHTGFLVDSQPAGAEVYVDGKRTGLFTPARVQHLASGLHSLDLKLADYYNTALPAFLEDGVMVQLPVVALRPLQGAASPASQQAPPGAEPATPRAGSEPRADEPHPQLTAADDLDRWPAKGRAPRRYASAPSAIGSSVDQASGVLRINSRPSSRVLVDGFYVGSTPQQSLRLPSGPHVVHLINDALKMSSTFKITVRQDRTVTRLVELH